MESQERENVYRVRILKDTDDGGQKRVVYEFNIQDGSTLTIIEEQTTRVPSPVNETDDGNSTNGSS